MLTGLGLNSRETQGARGKNPQGTNYTRTGRRVDSTKPRGLFRKKGPSRRGISKSRPLDQNRRLRLDYFLPKPVRNRSHPIPSQWPRFNDPKRYPYSNPNRTPTDRRSIVTPTQIKSQPSATDLAVATSSSQIANRHGGARDHDGESVAHVNPINPSTIPELIHPSPNR